MFTQDLRYAVRLLARNPGFTAVAVLALALGIGANSAIFSFTNAYMLRPLPFPDSDRIHFVRSIQMPVQRMSRISNHGEMLAWRESSRTTDSVVAIRFETYNTTETNPPEQVLGMPVSAGFFEILGARAQMGRVISYADETEADKRVVVVSYGFWQRLGGQKDWIGSTLHLNGVPHTVIGVMPASFAFPNPDMQLWVPMGLARDEAARKRAVVVLFRTKPGVSSNAAALELGEIARRMERSDAAGAGEWRLITSTLHDQLNHVEQAGPSIMVLTAAAGFVLLIACANIANLLLSRATARRKEIAIRRAIGAGSGHLMRQMLIEAVVLAGCGGLVGVFLSYVGVRALVAVCPTWVLPLGGVDVDGRVFVFTGAVSILTGIIFGLVPAIQSCRGSLSGALKEGGRTGDASGRHWLRKTLVVCEMSAAVLLLIGAGLLIKSLYGTNADLGFRPENLLTMDVALPKTKYTSDTSVIAFYRDVTERFARIPGAVAAGATGRFGRGPVVPDGRVPTDPADEILANRFSTTAGYLSAMGLKLRSGRFFSDGDTQTSQPVAIVNESLAKRAWPGMDPVGRTIRWSKDDQLTRTVIGVVSDARGNPLEPVRPELYVVHTQKAAPIMQLVVRTAGNPGDAAKSARAEVAAVDRHQAVSNVRTMEDLLAFQIAPQRVTSGLLTVFAAVALLLAATGIYGVMAYSVSQRSHEFGLRVALGASRQQIASMVVREAGVLGLTGAAIGVAAAFALTRLMKAVLFGVSATDPVTFVSVPAVLTLTAIVAAYVPMLRATQVDPVQALRCD